jgi:hypothetical protein
VEFRVEGHWLFTASASTTGVEKLTIERRGQLAVGQSAIIGQEMLKYRVTTHITHTLVNSFSGNCKEG